MLGVGGPSYQYTYWSGIKLTSISGSSHKILIHEQTFPRQDIGVVTGLNVFGPPDFVTLASWHAGLCNEGFADGHVEAMSPHVFDPVHGPIGSTAITPAYFYYVMLNSNR